MVLVGKGITFDTGGLSIKPGEAMVNMKRDMTGGAVVMSVMAALADVGCPVRVVGLVPAAENAISGNALRPGDVVRHYGGRTSRSPTPTPRADWCWPTRWRGPSPTSSPPYSSTWPPSPARSRWRSASRSAACSPTTTRWPTRSSSPARARVNRCGGSRWPRSTRTSSPRGSPTPTTPAAARARSSPRSSSSTSPATCRGPTSTSPRPATRPRTTTSTPRGLPASAPGCCSTGSARADPLAGIGRKNGTS